MLQWRSATRYALVALLATLAAGAVAPPVLAQATDSTPASQFRQFAPGILARTAYVVTASGPYRVELWDLLVGPGRQSEAEMLKGGAVFEVRAGSGRIELDGKSQELRPGMTFAVPQGVRFAIHNRRDDLGISIRAVVVAARVR